MCLACGFTDYDIAGWEIGHKTYTILGKKYTPLKSRANMGPCVACERIVVGVPLILFIDEGRGGELDFRMECAENLEIFEEVGFEMPSPPAILNWVIALYQSWSIGVNDETTAPVVTTLRSPRATQDTSSHHKQRNNLKSKK